jgi:hypothetical protein
VTAERWTFGVEPLPQTVEAAQALRRVAALVVAMEGEDEEVARLLDDLRRAESHLSSRVPPSPLPRVGAAVESDGRVYLDHASDMWSINPGIPEYELSVDGDRASGRVNFPIAFEGPPGIVHGGFLGVFFDSAMQHHNCEVGVAGKSTSLALRFRRPTPLVTDLDFSLERTEADGRIRSTGTLMRGDEVLCTAELEAVAGDRSALPEVSPRRAGA